MKMKRYLPLAALVIALCACSSDEIPTYSGESYIYFQKASNLTSSVSFAVMPGVDEYELRIPLTVIGFMPNQDLPFSIEAVTAGDNCTTLSPSSYAIPVTPVFHKGVYNDTLRITLFRTAEIDNRELKLVLALRDNDNYKVRTPANSTATIIVGDVLVRPDWWTTQIETIFLGPYTEEKYMAFITATGEWDLSEKTSDEIIGYVRDFIYYLRAMDDVNTPVYEADGSTKVLDSITYTNA
jgi:hypothetical protein